MHSTTPDKPNRMDRKKNRTKAVLMAAASELVLEKGYEDVMIDEITELADVGRRTFYNHFASKEECVLAALKKRYAEHAEELEQSLGLPLPQDSSGAWDHALVIAKLASNMFRLIALDPMTEQLIDYPRILSDAVAESQRDHLLAHLANGVVAGRLKPSLPPESLEPMVAWGFVGLVVTSIRRKSQEADSKIWGSFLLQNLGISATEASELLGGISA